MGEHQAKRLRRAGRDRLDHILPQGYLDSFTDPACPGDLWVRDNRTNRWFRSGTARVAAERGFYDYSHGSNPDQTADRAFEDLEGKFPNVRTKLISYGFAACEQYRETLLAFAQMLRARSKLFRDQDLDQGRQLTIARIETIEQVPSATRPGEFDSRIKYGPYQGTKAERELFLRNKTITDMRSEIAKGSAWMGELHWCLRFTDDPSDPVVTGDNAVLSEGRVQSVEQALVDHETLFFFPICWQACLIGSRCKFDNACEAFHPADLRRIRALYLKPETHFSYSPTVLRIEA
jgi:hypothetical protein